MLYVFALISNSEHSHWHARHILGKWFNERKKMFSFFWKIMKSCPWYKKWHLAQKVLVVDKDVFVHVQVYVCVGGWYAFTCVSPICVCLCCLCSDVSFCMWEISPAMRRPVDIQPGLSQAALAFLRQTLCSALSSWRCLTKSRVLCI